MAAVHYKDIIDFIVVAVLYKYILVHGAANILNWLFKKAWHLTKKRLIKTHRDLAVYLHYRNEQLKKS